MRTSPYAGATRGCASPCAHAWRAMMGGCPGPAASTGWACGSALAWPSSPEAAARRPAPSPPLTSTRCRRTPAKEPAARSCTALVPPVQIASPVSPCARAPAPRARCPRRVQLVQVRDGRCRGLAVLAAVVGDLELGEFLGEAGIGAAGADPLQRGEVVVVLPAVAHAVGT